MYDFHTHFIPKDVMPLEENQKIVNAEWIKKDINKEDFLFINQKWGFELKKTFTDFDLYKREQEKANVTHSMISSIPQLFLYDFSVGLQQKYPESITNLLPI